MTNVSCVEMIKSMLEYQTLWLVMELKQVNKVILLMTIYPNLSNGKTQYTYLPQSACDESDSTAPSTGSSNSFSLWGFLTAGIVMSSVIGNIINNVNSNNNNNNNNNNQISNNNRNDNINNGENSNVNTNMIIPGRKREFSGDVMMTGLKNIYENTLKGCIKYVLRNFLRDEGAG